MLLARCAGVLGRTYRLSLCRHLHTKPKKRFYKNATVVQNDGHFEINLDHRKLKSPSGSVFKVENEALALAVANEWMSQKDKILLSQMHLNGLCNTCQDNPGRTDKQTIVQSVLSFLSTDTVLYYADDPAPLVDLQVEKWSPVVLWFRERFRVELEPTQNISTPVISDGDRQILEKHLMSYNWNTIQGLSFGVDALKSVILMLAVVERHLTVEQAVDLARLELNFQTSHWGSVEWAHDIELEDTRARVAAAAIFVHLNNTSYTHKSKNVQ